MKLVWLQWKCSPALGQWGIGTNIFKAVICHHEQKKYRSLGMRHRSTLHVPLSLNSILADNPWLPHKREHQNYNWMVLKYQRQNLWKGGSQTYFFGTVRDLSAFSCPGLMTAFPEHSRCIPFEPTRGREAWELSFILLAQKSLTTLCNS